MRFNWKSSLAVFLGVVIVAVTYVRVILPSRYEMLEKSSFLMRRLQHLEDDIVPVSAANKCGEEKHHVAFIKVHKAGSSTIANILFRFGFTRNLTFLMPAGGVTISLDLFTPWTNIMPLPAWTDHYDILSNHAVYEKTEIQRLFPEDTTIIAVLRKPMGQLESSMYYYYSGSYKGQQDKVGAYLKNPEQLRGDRYVNNSMAYELGVPRKQFYNSTFVRLHAEKIAKEIDLVLILERLDESLVLLKRRLCWKLTDILYIIRNVNKKKPSIKRTEEEHDRLKQLMPAHYILYDFFFHKLEMEILSSPRIDEEVSHFKNLLVKVSDFCNGESGDSLHVKSSEWNEEFVIPRVSCELFLFNGVQVLQYARSYQYGDNWAELKTKQ